MVLGLRLASEVLGRQYAKQLELKVFDVGATLGVVTGN